uniref:Uncharacterized protein n=1 Tax=Meloidogyne hapla TaxID=6305 RepID=A0A1I8B591_MELHA
MQLSGNTTGAYKRKVGRRSRNQNRSEVGQPFLILPNLNKKLKFSKRSLTTVLVMAIKIGIFIGAFAVLFSLVRGDPQLQAPPQPDQEMVDSVRAIQTLLQKPPLPFPPPPPPPFPQECFKCGLKCEYPNDPSMTTTVNIFFKLIRKTKN